MENFTNHYEFMRQHYARMKSFGDMYLRKCDSVSVRGEEFGEVVKLYAQEEEGTGKEDRQRFGATLRQFANHFKTLELKRERYNEYVR
ncbi:hypothetical protein KIPB_012175, partial [Kipferlia bialata]|eukprot:g12175.t1